VELAGAKRRVPVPPQCRPGIHQPVPLFLYNDLCSPLRLGFTIASLSLSLSSIPERRCGIDTCPAHHTRLTTHWNNAVSDAGAPRCVRRCAPLLTKRVHVCWGGMVPGGMGAPGFLRARAQAVLGTALGCAARVAPSAAVARVLRTRATAALQAAAALEPRDPTAHYALGVVRLHL
jgi:hypothetical protein